MQNYKLYEHIIQSYEWGLFKAKMGTPAIRVGDIQITKHKIPGLPYYIGYAPRVNFYIQKFSFKELKAFAKDEKCACIRFDVPNIIDKSYNEDSKFYSHSSTTEKNKIIKWVTENCVKSPKSTFAGQNVLLDISQDLDLITSKFSQKTRYNIKLATKHDVEVITESSEKAFDTFYKLHSETAKRQGFLAHGKKYYKTAFDTLSSKNMAHLLIAYKDSEALAAWMLFNYKNVLYYPYGGSSLSIRKVMPSNLLAFEAIKLGKDLNCHTFDMWGATDDENDPYWGFTKFKLGYGGELVNYIDSYDFVVNKPIYKTFNFAYDKFWKIVKKFR